jgi:dTDP-4-amino-4,6-dideoxygalactose transaminase
MSEVMRAVRRLSGLYVPYLQPYWDEQDVAAFENWLDCNSPEDGRDMLRAALNLRFPKSADIVLTDTGKSAFYVALKMLGVEGSASEVILPSYCCASIVASVVRGGCTPVFTDSDEHFNISFESVIAALSPQTRAILVPHLFGLKASSLESIVALGRERNIAVIEDVTQAYGLRLPDGSFAGSVGDAAIFSAGLGKPLMGPGGGWLVLNRPAGKRPELGTEPQEEHRARIADFARRFTGARPHRGRGEILYSVRARLSALLNRWSRFDIPSWAERQCHVRTISVGDAWFAARQIERIDMNLECRAQNARRWRALLMKAKIPCSTLPDAENIYAVFPLLFRGESGARQSNVFRATLENEGIATEPCYTPLHLRDCGKTFRRTEMAMIESIWKAVFAVSVRPNLQAMDWKHIENAVLRAADIVVS